MSPSLSIIVEKCERILPKDFGRRGEIICLKSAYWINLDGWKNPEFDFTALLAHLNKSALTTSVHVIFCTLDSAAISALREAKLEVENEYLQVKVGERSYIVI